MTFDEIVERAKHGDDSDMSPIEMRAYLGIKQQIDFYKKGYTTKSQVKLMRDVIKLEYEDSVRLHDEAYETFINAHVALTKSNSAIRGIIKAINDGDRDYKSLFLTALSAYSFVTGEGITESVIRKKLKED